MTVSVSALIGPLSVLGVYPPSGGGGGGTVTNVGTGLGLTGGPITTTGTISLAAIPVGDVLANVGGFSAAPNAVSVTDLLDLVMGNTQGNILYRNATVWTALAPSTAGFVLATGGPGADPAWVAGGGYTPFAYQNAYWMANANGSDSNLGTSIETPFLTLQYAVNTAATTASTIYIEDYAQNTETISTMNTAQSLYISAPGVNFQGAWLVDTNDSVQMHCNGISSTGLTNNGTLQLTCETASNILGGSTASTFIHTSVLNGATINGGTAHITCQQAVGTISFLGAATVTFLAQDVSGATITNDGTCVVNGILGGTLSGLSGNQAIGGSLSFGDGTATNYAQTNAAPTAANQVLVSSGAGPNATTSWAAQSGGGLIPWVTISGTSQTASANTDYIPTNVGLTTITMPATAPVGTLIGVEGFGTGGWVLQAAVGQNFWVYGVVSSTGGTLASTSNADNAYLVCVVADSTWKVQSTNSQGLTIV